MDFSVAKVEAMVRQRGNKSKGKYGFLSLGFGTAEKEKKRSSWLGLARLTRLSLRFRAATRAAPTGDGLAAVYYWDVTVMVWMDGCCKRLSLRLTAATRAAPTGDGLAAVYYWDVTVIGWTAAVRDYR
jgi:hypothetical protein